MFVNSQQTRVNADAYVLQFFATRPVDDQNDLGVLLEDLERHEARLRGMGLVTRMIDLKKLGLEGVEGLPFDVDRVGNANILVASGGLAVFPPRADNDFLQAHRSVVSELQAMPFQCKEPAKSKEFLLNNRHARYTCDILDHRQDADLENEKTTIVDANEYQTIHRLRGALTECLGESTHPAIGASALLPRGGIGYKGEDERPLLASLLCGPRSHLFQIKVSWFYQNRRCGREIIIDLTPGDLIFFTSKSSGADHKKPSIPTLRHAVCAEDTTVAAANWRPNKRQLAEMGGTYEPLDARKVGRLDEVVPENS
jgi:hypothetical protein